MKPKFTDMFTAATALPYAPEPRQSITSVANGMDGASTNARPAPASAKEAMMRIKPGVSSSDTNFSSATSLNEHTRRGRGRGWTCGCARRTWRHHRWPQTHDHPKTTRQGTASGFPHANTTGTSVGETYVATHMMGSPMVMNSVPTHTNFHFAPLSPSAPATGVAIKYLHHKNHAGPECPSQHTPKQEAGTANTLTFHGGKTRVACNTRTQRERQRTPTQRCPAPCHKQPSRSVGAQVQSWLRRRWSP